MLLTHHGLAKIADFGLSRFFQQVSARVRVGAGVRVRVRVGARVRVRVRVSLSRFF